MKKKISEDKPEAESKLAEGWMRVLYDPRTDLTLLDLDDDYVLDKIENPDRLINRMASFGHISEDEKNTFTDFSPFTINANLNSPESAMRKTGVLFLLCREMLAGLKKKQFKKNGHLVLYHLMFNGITFLLSRIVNNNTSVSVPLPQPRSSFLDSFLNIEGNTLRFTHFHLDTEKFESSPVATPASEIFGTNTAYISIEEIKSIIDQPLHIPYALFINIIDVFLDHLGKLNSVATNTLLLAEAPNYNPINYQSAFTFFASLRESFLRYKSQILREDREELFYDCNLEDKDREKPSHDCSLFPINIQKIIYRYADSRSLWFFNLKRELELVSDHWHPENQPLTPSS